LGKLQTLLGQQVCGILARHGFVEIRQRGVATSLCRNNLKMPQSLCRYPIIPKYALEHFSPLFANQELPGMNSKFNEQSNKIPLIEPDI